MNSSTELPESLICLIGPPRGGTTLIANAFASHTKVTGILEPYHRGRHENYIETDLANLLRQNEISDFVATPHIAIKETFTRMANVKLTIKLLQSAALHNVYSGLILIFRCPFTSYLSQVSASQNRWLKNKMNEDSERSLNNWAKGQRSALSLLLRHAQAQHFRFVSYEQFCAQPESELARLMALIPESLQPYQLQFRPPKGIVGSADPKTREKSGGIVQSDYTEQIDALIERYSDLPSMKFLQPLRSIILDRIGRDSDLNVLNDLARLVTRDSAKWD